MIEAYAAFCHQLWLCQHVRDINGAGENPAETAQRARSILWGSPLRLAVPSAWRGGVALQKKSVHHALMSGHNNPGNFAKGPGRDLAAARTNVRLDQKATIPFRLGFG
jgi:hypothetical protein